MFPVICGYNVHTCSRADDYRDSFHPRPGGECSQLCRLAGQTDGWSRVGTGDLGGGNRGWGGGTGVYRGEAARGEGRGGALGGAAQQSRRKLGSIDLRGRCQGGARRKRRGIVGGRGVLGRCSL